ncbi:sugar fermentation stimulation protein [Ruminiclostridium papyrosolvens DSM 2782]|uniref:Sugar fermentation stimulation protein n=1 Tax=Ruminiclostridium papyrosolvens DSM 2782 TaxID=588581 RepID=F1THD2_9FIRM|nr:DNA/RNA nuclease SfsA [Ruminiclostridium papyrosolvens]EGD46135.1 sugar fermentation stimulation protein [Ruminiclostridium papyrosolvens DSM 2782]WES35920.1 DNA/RNA nuclease SfsA [Ruminiclostridium papyrosolvens DSM 2782]
MKIVGELIEGIFKSESKNRFLCKVLIMGNELECYLPSSSKLSPLINLKGKRVLLTLNRGTDIRTKYSVFAVQYYRNYILLNLNITNRILEEDIRKNYKLCKPSDIILKEKTIEGYKADLILPDHKTLFEAKSIISTKKAALFPSVYPQRAIEQLQKIEALLDLGWNVKYCFIALSPYVKTISINLQYETYLEQLKKCLEKGMKVEGLGCTFNNNEVNITHKLKVII